jgi:hypothetical protein
LELELELESLRAKEHTLGFRVGLVCAKKRARRYLKCVSL